ncbi:hypothetical protein BC940DRAFT_307309 [Gongronella butleri]|nr:hypothetical protein BC940DRAFT_307309 [Gongronella butleri]
MAPPTKKKRVSIEPHPSPLLPASAATTSFVAMPQALAPYPAPHVIPIVYHQSPTGQPQYFIQVASPSNALTPAHPATAPPTPSASSSSSKYERILPKRPSDATSSPVVSPYTYAVHSASPNSALTTLPPPSLALPPQLALPPTHGAHPGAYHHHAMGPPAAVYSSPADQREKARKMSHSAIERRRRERINDKIMQLKAIIPTCANQEYLHKLSILQSAIDYIKYLKNIVDENNLQLPDHAALAAATRVPQAASAPLPPASTHTLVEDDEQDDDDDDSKPLHPSSPPSAARIDTKIVTPRMSPYHHQLSPPTPTPTVDDQPAQHQNQNQQPPAPLKPMDVMKKANPHTRYQSSSRSPTPPTSHVTSKHMKLDHLLS